MITALARRLIGTSSLMPALLVSFWPACAPALSCAQAAAVAEAAASVPPGLLLAIGNVESGRTDATGLRAPWPWTINAGGAGHFFDSAEDAVRAVQSLRAGGLASIDIGCFQINLFHHPNAFTDLASGFDPLTNAMAAARFLASLHEEFNAWEPAVAAYHSRLDVEGAPYRNRVLAVWRGTPLPPTAGINVARINFSGINVAGIHVWGPAGEITPSTGLSSWTTVSRVRLPHVVTASIR